MRRVLISNHSPPDGAGVKDMKRLFFDEVKNPLSYIGLTVKQYFKPFLDIGYFPDIRQRKDCLLVLRFKIKKTRLLVENTGFSIKPCDAKMVQFSISINACNKAIQLVDYPCFCGSWGIISRNDESCDILNNCGFIGSKLFKGTIKRIREVDGGGDRPQPLIMK